MPSQGLGLDLRGEGQGLPYCDQLYSPTSVVDNTR